MIDNSEETVLYYKDIIEAKDKKPEPGPESFRDYSTIIRDNITPDNSIRTPLGVVVMGNVLPGGQVISDNDIIILGNAAGVVSAGSPENKSAVVYAYDFKDCLLSIGGVTDKAEQAGGSIFKKIKKSKGLIRAYVSDNKIWFEQVI